MDDYIESADDLARFFYSIAEAESHGEDMRIVVYRYTAGANVSGVVKREFILSDRYKGLLNLNGRTDRIKFVELTPGLFRASVTRGTE